MSTTQSTTAPLAEVIVLHEPKANERAAMYQSVRDDPEATEFQRACWDIAMSDNILKLVVADLHRTGLVGEDRLVKLLYLAATSRLTNTPAGLIVKGQSSTGKSYVTDRVTELMPPEDVVRIDSMSSKALLYSEDADVRHRLVYVSEAVTIDDDFAALVVKLLMSQGRFDHRTTEQSDSGRYRGRTVALEGPAGFVTTTTRFALDGELETRCLSVNADESPEQTRRIVAATLGDDDLSHHDVQHWQAFQRSLALGERRVVLPFGRALAELIQDGTVRLRRDVKTMRQLIRAHALLHRSNREHDEEGRIVATLEDYAAVHDLLHDIVDYGAEASVPVEVRKVVEKVEELAAEGGAAVSMRTLRDELGLPEATLRRYVSKAFYLGFLRDHENPVGKSHQGKRRLLALGEAMPGDAAVLPAPEELRQRFVRVDDEVKPNE